MKQKLWRIINQIPFNQRKHRCPLREYHPSWHLSNPHVYASRDQTTSQNHVPRRAPKEMGSGIICPTPTISGCGRGWADCKGWGASQSSWIGANPSWRIRVVSRSTLWQIAATSQRKGSPSKRNHLNGSKMFLSARKGYFDSEQSGLGHPWCPSTIRFAVPLWLCQKINRADQYFGRGSKRRRPHDQGLFWHRAGAGFEDLQPPVEQIWLAWIFQVTLSAVWLLVRPMMKCGPRLHNALLPKQTPLPDGGGGHLIVSLTGLSVALICLTVSFRRGLPVTVPAWPLKAVWWLKMPSMRKISPRWTTTVTVTPVRTTPGPTSATCSRQMRPWPAPNQLPQPILPHQPHETGPSSHLRW